MEKQLENKENTNVKKESKAKKFFHDYFGYPLYLMSHPVGGFSEFREAKMSVALVYFVLMLITEIIKEVATGFLVAETNFEQFNLFNTLSIVILPLCVGTIANWCITALFDGKGTMKKIFMVFSYSFFPFVWLTNVGTIMSNFVVTEEIAYVTFMNTSAFVLMAYMIFFGLAGIHEYGLGKNILTIIFTIVAIAIILFLVLLFLSFIQQILQWIISIITEIRMRYF